MRVVVTRPERSGQKTAIRLRERGHQPVLLPLTIPVYNSKAAIAAFANQPAALAITSAEAMRALSETDITTVLHIPVFAVGKASATAAITAGFKSVSAGESDGVALAQHISQAMAPQGSVLYLAGKPREPGFENKLSALNVPFETIEIYEMQVVGWQHAALELLIASAPIDAVLFYSAEAARLFFMLMETELLLDRLRGCKLICISTKVISHIPKAFQHMASAGTLPNEAEMFDLLDHPTGT